MTINMKQDREDGAMATRADCRRIAREEIAEARLVGERGPEAVHADISLQETIEDAAARAYDRGYEKGRRDGEQAAGDGDDNILKGMLMVREAVTRQHEGSNSPEGVIAHQVMQVITDRMNGNGMRLSADAPADGHCSPFSEVAITETTPSNEAVTISEMPSGRTEFVTRHGERHDLYGNYTETEK